jgi:hypothetical protein
MRKSPDQNIKDIYVAIPAAALFVFMGIGLVYGGLYFYNNIKSVRENGIKTEGVILMYELRGTKTQNKKDMFFVPIVRFQTATGRVFEVEGRIDNKSALQKLCKSGAKVEIIYDPQNPKRAVINTFAELWFVPLLAWFIGVGFIIVPPFTIWKYYQEQRKGKAE